MLLLLKVSSIFHTKKYLLLPDYLDQHPIDSYWTLVSASTKNIILRNSLKANFTELNQDDRQVSFQPLNHYPLRYFKSKFKTRSYPILSKTKHLQSVGSWHLQK
jgi:hypothetical protein